MVIIVTYCKNKRKKRLLVLFIFLWKDTKRDRKDLGFTIKRHYNKQRAVIIIHPTTINADKNRRMDLKLFLSSIQENYIVVKEKGTINFINTKTGKGSTIFSFSNKSEE